jgi:hypothetical protein
MADADVYVEFEKLPPIVAEIRWSNNNIIIEKRKVENERKFYMRIPKKYRWTKKVLVLFHSFSV